MGAFGGAVAAASLLGVRANRRGMGWSYGLLKKPSWQPPPRVFGPVWTVLYGLMAGAGYRVWKSAPGPGRNRALALWATQLGLNAAWSPLFFGRKRPRAALADLALLLPAVAATTAASARVDGKAGAMLAPYLAWTGFATALNRGIVRKNRRRLAVARALRVNALYH